MTNDFDIASKTYDTDFTFSKIGKAQRDIVYKNLSYILNTKCKLDILELNCGTGFDALNFAKSGHQVIATDISEGMITVANAKELPANILFKTLDINTIETNTFSKKFDVIFSNFGGFNCLTKTEIESFLKKAVALLKPNGKITLVIMPKQCVWERFYFTLKGALKKAKRRQTNQSVIANVEGIGVNTWYYNPKDILNLSETHFKTNTIKPIGLSIPPSYLEGSIASKKYILNLFKRIDSVFTAPIFAKYADHFLIELQLK